MSNFILAMLLCPEAFKRAQAELDVVTGGSRLPDFEDRGSLPYLDCILSEVLRYECFRVAHIDSLANVLRFSYTGGGVLFH